MADIVVATTEFGSEGVSVVLSTGGGCVGPVTRLPVSGGGRPEIVATGDFDGDGFLDIVASTSSGADVFINNGAGGFGLAIALNFGTANLSQSGVDVDSERPALLQLSRQ